MISEKKFDFLYKYDKPINWNVTGFGNEIFMYIIQEYLGYIKKFNVENPIKTIHGSYISKYNGGRLASYIYSNNYIYDKIREFNNMGIGVKLTFSNPYFTQETLEEKELNEYLEVLNERKDLENGIICSVDDFADYIHQKYPSIKVTSSYVKMASETQLGKTDTVDYYNNLFDKYDIIVINTAKAFDDEFLDQIKYKDRIEFIVNNSCNLNCPIAHKHYEKMYKFSQRIKYLYENNIRTTDPKMELIVKDLKSINDNCRLRRIQNNIEKIKYQQLNRDEINYLCNKGINNFKLEGRDLDFEFFITILFTYIFNNESVLRMHAIMPSEDLSKKWHMHKLIYNS